jgi:outer membrane protein
LVPLLLYNGKYLFSRGTAAGVHILNRPFFQFSLLARVRFDNLHPGDSEFYEGIEDRLQSIDAGAEMRVHGQWGEFKSVLLTDTLSRHEGQSAEVSYRYRFDFERFSISPFVSWEWRDADLSNYYYGVSAEEARPDRPEYAPGNSQWYSLGFNSSYKLTDRVTVFGNLGLDLVDSAVNDSPIVDASKAATLYLGGIYTFGNLLEPEHIISPERASEWSWRVNYGYSAGGNIIGEIDHGDFEPDSFANTTLAGITLSKLLVAGERADYLARAAVYRHFEGSIGTGPFNSYALFLSAMGKGYGAWSREEWFRWSFGFGLSYAEKVPINEQLEQIADAENYSRVLSYMDMQVDFPLRRLFKSKWVHNCYAGVTVVHRSGVFGASDVLGDVAGGADWITAHLECIRN